MSEPKRYTISGLHPHIIESKDGFMVYYEDYARLVEQVECLKAEVEELKSQPDPLTAYLYAAELGKDDRKKLQAHIERLTKVGDAMADYLFDAPYPCRVFYHKWKEAKEGKGQP